MKSIGSDIKKILNTSVPANDVSTSSDGFFVKTFLQKCSQINLRKSHRISWQLNKSTIYGNKMLEAADLVGPLTTRRVNYILIEVIYSKFEVIDFSVISNRKR